VRKLLCSLVLSVLSCSALAAATLYSVGPDGYASPRYVYQLPTTPPGSSTWVDMIGAEGTGYGGGLAWRPSDGLLYTIGYGSDGQGYEGFALWSFAPGTGWLNTALVLPLLDTTIGWNGGLAFDSADGNLYAAGTNAGISQLYRLNGGAANPVGGAIGDGTWIINGGMTYNSSDGFLYGIGIGDYWSSSLIRIDPSTGAFTNVLPDFGPAYRGGLAYDPDADLFYALQTDEDGYAHLYTISLAGKGSVTNLYDLPVYNNWGFWNAGLALVDEEGQVPEPATAALALAAILAVALLRRRTVNR